MRSLFASGAHVVFGDVDVAAAQRIMDDLTKSAALSTPGTVAFRKTDVREYQDTVGLFEEAMARHGRVDDALSIAGVTEGQNWFDQALDLESVRQPPSTSVLDINLVGALYFARVAAVFLRQGNGSRCHKSLLLVGSLASFKEQPGLCVYSAAKHGVMGLFRSLRTPLQQLDRVRINVLLPSLISTAMSRRIQHIWEEHGLPINSASEVADFALSLTASEDSGLAVEVEGGKGWEIESELERLDVQWMGAEFATNCANINKALGCGSSWTTDR